MSSNSIRIKKWRLESKQRIVDAMGGECQICGYSRCLANLALHHIDPSKKDFRLGAIRANPKSWNKIVEELRKCVLLCHICHNELHYGVIQLPAEYKKFDEKFANYKFKKKILRQCPVCKGVITVSGNKVCSNKCAGQLRQKINWNDIKLEELIKVKTIVGIAKELGCSDSAVHKRLKKLGIKS